MTLVSVHSFGIASPGGGPRILRALYADAPQPVAVIATGLEPPPPADATELHLPLRPRIPKLDGTRFAGWAYALDLPLAGLGMRRLSRAYRELDASVIHCVAHGPEFWPAFRAAKRWGLPFLLTVHDDMRYLQRRTPLLGATLARLGRVWREADARFVITEAIGREYDARYGRRPFSVVTDGLSAPDIALRPRPARDGFRVYFAGLFHTRYLGNLRALVTGLERVSERTGRSAALTLRCGTVPELPATSIRVDVTPFAPEAQVRADLDRADILWLPLMFEPESRDMIRFSLSTKLVTYLGSGLPILYHGPPEGAAFELLARHDAAIFATEPGPDAVADALAGSEARAGEITENALALARERFGIERQRETFWGAVDQQLP